MSCSKRVQMVSAWSWSTLSLDLTGLILCCLPGHTDRLRFGAVCRNWHFASMQHRLSPPLPWLALHDGTFFSLPHSESFQFPNSSVFHSCSGEWLVFVQDGACSLMNPFTMVTSVLPNISNIHFINEPADIVNGPKVQSPDMDTPLLNMFLEISIRKVTVCSLHLVAAIFDIESTRTIGFCEPGAASWFLSNLCSEKGIMDIVFYEGKLYASNSNELFAISIEKGNDPGEPRVSRIECVVVGPPLRFTRGVNFVGSSQFLVECHGALLRVCREAHYKGSYPSGTSREHTALLDVKFLVFEADLRSSQWVEMKSVGDDTALFIGRGCSRSVCMSQYKPWGNCIFSLDDGSSCIYNMRDEKLYSPPGAEWMGKKGPGAWLFPQL